MQKLREQLDVLKSECRPGRGSLFSDSLEYDDDYDVQSKFETKIICYKTIMTIRRRIK